MSETLAKTVPALAHVLEVFASGCAAIALRTVARSEFEHAIEARTAFLLLEGHAKSLQILAKAGPSTAPSGWPVSRAMLEVGLRTAWRMDDDPLIAEARWLAWFGKYVKYEKRRAQTLAAEGLEEASHGAAQAAAAADAFRDEFKLLLQEKGVAIPTREPTLVDVLKELGLPDHNYAAYSESSERLHGSFVAVDAYSRHLGTMREMGRFSEWKDWILPLANGMRGTYVLAQIFADRTQSAAMWNEVSEASAAWEAVRRRSLLRL